jgi:hypothetical protein
MSVEPSCVSLNVTPFHWYPPVIVHDVVIGHRIQQSNGFVRSWSTIQGSQVTTSTKGPPLVPTTDAHDVTSTILSSLRLDSWPQAAVEPHNAGGRVLFRPTN